MTSQIGFPSALAWGAAATFGDEGLSVPGKTDFPSLMGVAWENIPPCFGTG